MRDQKQAHWGTTQGDAWSLLALTEYARQVEGQRQPAEGQLKWGAQSIPFHLDDRTNIFTLYLGDNKPGGSEPDPHQCRHQSSLYERPG